MSSWLLIMQCGFAFLEAGAVRSKNVTNILIKNVFDCFVCGVAFWLFGYAFAFGDGNNFIGYKYFALNNLPDNLYASFFFQYTFAATAATIVSGAVCERCQFASFFAYSFCITGFIYPVVTHWHWGGGFLAQGKDYGGDIGVVKFHDYAGSGLVHILGGTASFCGALVLGPRIGRFDSGIKSAVPIRGHSVPIAALGGFILFFGFLAFNGGSQTTIQNEGDGPAMSKAVVNTVISASFAAFSSLIINRIKLFGNASWSLLITINGALTGMVAACAGCNVIHTWGACVIGCFSGIAYYMWSYIIRKLKIDDPLDAAAVHFGGGIWGVIAVAFLHQDDGILFNWNARSGLFLAWQLLGLTVITLWTGVLSMVLFGVLKCLKVLRVSEETEIKGLDIALHQEPAYPVEAYGHGHIEKIIQILEHTPTQVIQSFAKSARYAREDGEKRKSYVFEVADHGPYENPEVAHHHSRRSSNSSETPDSAIPTVRF